MSIESIHQNLLKNTSDVFDKSKGSWTSDVQKSVATELNEHEQKVIDITNKLNVENLVGEELTRFVYQRTGIKRREATFASGEVLITTTAPATINEGDLVAADDVFYRVSETVTFNSAGQFYVFASCTQAGTIGNVPVGAINAFPVTLSNISAVTNERAFSTGYEAESDQLLRQRYYDKLQRPGKAGNKYHYKEWAQEVSGVGKVKVFPRWNGPLTVKVAILDANNAVAPQLLINSVFNHIEEERPFGANVTVVTASELIINTSATFILKVGYMWPEVEPLILGKLQKYYQEISFTEGLTYVSHAQVGREILSVEGIQDYSNLLLNGSTGNVAIGEIEVPIVGSVTSV